MRPATIFLTALALAAAGCGSSDKKDTSTTKPAAQSAPAETSSTPAATSASTGDTTTKASPTVNLNRKPAIPRQAGSPPRTLVTQDIVKGKGATAGSGDQVTVRYVRVRFR